MATKRCDELQTQPSERQSSPTGSTDHAARLSLEVKQQSLADPADEKHYTTDQLYRRYPEDFE